MNNYDHSVGVLRVLGEFIQSHGTADALYVASYHDEIVYYIDLDIGPCYNEAEVVVNPNPYKSLLAGKKSGKGKAAKNWER